MLRRSWVVPIALFALAACGSSEGSSAPSGSPSSSPSGDGSGSTPGSSTPSGDAPVAAAPADTGPYPIVLLHGMAGFVKVDAIDLVYFNGVKDDLAKHGETEVYATKATPYASSEDRVKDIAPQIDAILKATGKSKVNVIGHSQGGMDARVLASPAGAAYGDRIASVTTIATPHRGSKVADLVLGLVKDVPDDVFDSVTGQFLSVLQKTFYDVQHDPDLHTQLVELSEDYAAHVFNPKYVDDPRVYYASYAGRTNFETGVADCGSSALPNDPAHVDAAQPMLAPTAVFLEEGHGVSNDGLVSVASARWGAFQQCVPADHLKEVGQLGVTGPDALSSFDHLAFFRSVVAQIRARGL